MPTPTKVRRLPTIVQTEPALLVAKTIGLAEAPPVAVSVTAAAPNTTGEAGAKPVIVCVACVMLTLALTGGAAR